MLSMMSAASRMVLDLDLLLIDTASSSSDLISYKAVVFFVFLLSQISSKPALSRATEGYRKGSSAVNSSLKDIVGERSLL